MFFFLYKSRAKNIGNFLESNWNIIDYHGSYLLGSSNVSGRFVNISGRYNAVGDIWSDEWLTAMVKG